MLSGWHRSKRCSIQHRGALAAAAPAAPPAGGAVVTPSRTQKVAPSPIHEPLHSTFPINLTDIFNAGNLSLLSSDKSNPENILTNFYSSPKIFLSLKNQTNTKLFHCLGKVVFF